VTKASRSTKKGFLKYGLTESGAEAIRRRLKMEPGHFCRVAEGVTVHESMVISVRYASSPEVTSRMRGSIRHRRAQADRSTLRSIRRKRATTPPVFESLRTPFGLTVRHDFSFPTNTSRGSG
jgi:hypothetical protein